jgi:hypothetical protein
LKSEITNSKYPSHPSPPDTPFNTEVRLPFHNKTAAKNVPINANPPTTTLHPKVVPAEGFPVPEAGKLGAGPPVCIAEPAPAPLFGASPFVFVVAAASEVETPGGTTLPTHDFGGSAVLPGTTFWDNCSQAAFEDIERKWAEAYCLGGIGIADALGKTITIAFCNADGVVLAAPDEGFFVECLF